jgi:hypothetical protein
MKRFKSIMAIIALSLFIPLWRLLDFAIFFSPNIWLQSVLLFLSFVVMVFYPSKILFNKIKSYQLITGLIAFSLMIAVISPLSQMTTTQPHLNHCGSLTYTGLLYPAKGLLSEAFNDDLEARNQMCWIRKMILKVPENFDTVAELEDYTKLIEKKLFKPEIKYRVALPLTAFLYITINRSLKNNFRIDKVYHSLHFWIDHYTDEISERDYGFWNRPFSDYIKIEYRLIEKNWQKLVDNLMISY